MTKSLNQEQAEKFINVTRGNPDDPHIREEAWRLIIENDAFSGADLSLSFARKQNEILTEAIIYDQNVGKETLERFSAGIRYNLEADRVNFLNRIGADPKDAGLGQFLDKMLEADLNPRLK